MRAVPALGLLRATAAVVVVAGASVAATRLFAGSRDLPLLLGAVLAGAAAPTLLGLLRPGLPGAGRVAAGAATVTAYVLLALAPGGDVVDGPRRLLTGALPLDPAGPELATVAVVVGLAGLLAAELSLRSARTPVAALPGLVSYPLVLWAGASGPPAPPVALLLVVLGCAGLLAVTAARPRARSRADDGPRLAGSGRSRATARSTVPAVLAAAVAVTVVSVCTVLVAPALPGIEVRQRPADARDLVAEPVRVSRETSPLVRFPALRQGPDRLLFVVRADDGVPPATLRLRWVTLDRFDGTTWTTTATYQRAGRTLPAGPDLAVPVVDRTVTVQVRAADATTWLPSVGRPVSVSTAGLGVDPRSGDLVVPAGRAAPVRYTVTGADPRLDPVRLRAALPEPPPAGRPDYDVPPAVTAAAQQAVAGARTTFGRLAGLESLFRTEVFTVAADEGAPAGHGLFQLSRLLRERTGTAEQYASAFAVMARGLGYDARLVMGFRAPYDDGVDGWVVRARSVQVWPEVRLAGLGWVAFQPTPTRRSDGSEDPGADDSGRSAVDQAVQQEQAARQAPPTSPPPARPDARDDASAAPWGLVLAVLAAVLGLVVVGVLLVPLAKLARRRSRRLRPDPRDRVLGAWREAADRLTEHGLPSSGALSRPEVASAAADREPGVAEPLRSLARLADDAGFAPGGPPPGADDLAWEHTAAVARTLRGRGLPARVRAAVDPRPLARR